MQSSTASSGRPAARLAGQPNFGPDVVKAARHKVGANPEAAFRGERCLQYHSGITSSLQRVNEKGTSMSTSKRRPTLMGLIRRSGIAGPARSQALQGISAPAPNSPNNHNHMRPPRHERNDSNRQQPTGTNLNFDTNAIHESDFHAQVVWPTGPELEPKFAKSFLSWTKTPKYIAPLLILCSLGIFTPSAFAGTPPEPPQLEVTSKTATEVSFRGVLNPGAAGEPGHYEFLYNKSPTECEHGSHSTPGLSFGVQGEEYPETISSLEPGATYTACLQVENATHEKAESPPVPFTLLAEAPLTSTPARSIHPTTAVLEGTLNPLATGKAGWHFAYSNPGGSSCTEGPTTAQEVEVEGKALPEHKEVTGLEPGQTYLFCLVATNELGETTAGNEVSFTTEAVVPVVTADYPSEIEPETATLNASINPGGAATTYHFEYLTQAQFEADGNTFGAGATTTPESAPPLAADNSEHPATASLEKLHPNTTYHYRAVATNSLSPAGGTPGPDATFATPAPASTPSETCPNAQRRTEQPYGLTLPDCRAYEMVSPAYKGDNGVIEQDVRASTSDESPAATYESVGAFENPQATNYADSYLARRGSAGWSTQNITPPYQTDGSETVESFRELWFTPELSRGLVTSEGVPLTAGSPAGYKNIYLAETGQGASAGSQSSYQLVSTIISPEAVQYQPGNALGLYVDGASSADLSTVVFGEIGALTPGAPAGAHSVYAWEEGSGELHLVNVPPEGKSFEHHAYGPAGGGSVGAPIEKGEAVKGADVWHAVSANGSRVFFTAAEESDSAVALGQLYLRENPTRPPADGNDCAVPGDACTIEVSASQRTVPDPHGTNRYGAPRNPRYWDASTDGSRVFFTSDVELTNDAQTGPEDNAPNLYEYDVETKQLTDLTVNQLTAKGEGDPNGAAVLGLVTAGEDGSYVYFVAEGDLAPGASSGTPNLYLRHAGHTSFIATLAPATSNADRLERGGDSADWYGEDPEPEETGREGGAGGHTYGPGSHTVRVTPDGKHLAFQSRQSLTGFDNEQAAPGDCESGDPE